MAAATACPACAAENPAGARFCMACGSALERRCPDCGTAAPEAARFCMGCGADLGSGAAAPSPPPFSDSSADADERRTVTVLFADLSGYTAAAEEMDHEAVKVMVDRFLRRLGDEIVAVGGTIDKYIGDNVMALFGAPLSHEDDPERAVRAGLAMQAAMPEINARSGCAFSLRVGINTGEVTAGAVGDSYTVMGDVVNVAARLQSAGRPGSVTVGEQTYAATRAVVEYASVEPLELKGKAQLVPAWEALGMSSERPGGRSVAAGRSPFVGRGDEIGLLTSLFERVTREQRPHLVTLIGEAGVGKSRLLDEFTHAVQSGPAPASVRRGHCLAYGAGIVYWALGEVIRHECAITDADDSGSAWAKLAGTVERLFSDDAAHAAEPAERRAALIARLLGIEAGAESEPPGGDLEELREASFAAVRAFIEAMSRRAPVVLALEDIHWADSGMLDLIEYVAQWVRGPVLLLCLARNELLDRRTGWAGGRLNASTVVLEPLDTRHTGALVSSLLAEVTGGGALAEAVTQRAGGNPFFAEEMVRRIAEEGAADIAGLPGTVQAVLAARLDSLDPVERRLVQQAAVVGRTFWPSLLRSIVPQEKELAAALSSLQQKDIIVPSGSGQLAGERELAFKHVLIRDVAYATLPKAVRWRRHLEVAQFIEQRAGDRADEVVALLAEHYGRAALLGEETGLPDEELEGVQLRAVTLLEAAGDAAAAVFSNQEALEHYEAARSLRCVTDPDVLAVLASKQGDVALRLGRAAAAIELWQGPLEHRIAQSDLPAAGDLHRRIGSAFWHRGETQDAIHHFQQGINLLKDQPPSLELVALYEDAATVYMHAGDNMLAIYAAEKALRLAEQLGETRAASRAHGIFGRIFGRIGDVARARENLERSVELAQDGNPGESIRALLTLGSHLEIAEADYTGAGETYEQALALAQRLGDAPAQVELQAALGVLAAYRADWEALRAHADASAGLAEREGLVGKLAYPYALRGFLSWRAGDLAGAEALFDRSHELAVKVGWSEVAFWALYGLAVARRDRDDEAGALSALDQALDVCERAGLAAQAIQTVAARATTFALAGRHDEARQAADDATARMDGVKYPIADAAVAEARGAAAQPGDAPALLAEARSRWEELGRPLDAARCDMLLGRILAESDPDAAAEAVASAAERFAVCGVTRG